MAYINTGAFVNGTRPKSKKALREALRDAPQTVTFDGTSPMGPQFTGSAEEVPVDVTLTVTGPDPYTKRNWFASVTRDPNGAFKIT